VRLPPPAWAYAIDDPRGLAHVSLSEYKRTAAAYTSSPVQFLVEVIEVLMVFRFSGFRRFQRFRRF